MKHEIVNILGYDIDIYTLNTIIVGSGAAGLNAASRLYSFGVTDIAIVTEHINAGTSRNAGSDKQTYYKLTLSGNEPDSIFDMAKTLFSGGCVDGDIALVEAALSVRCFIRLCDLGVPFPVNRYGEYVGYRTDHDPRRRATSAGPLTSKLMVEALYNDVLSKNIKIFDKLQVISIITNESKVIGILCISLKEDNKPKFIAFNCKNVIYATGGPAGIYADSVYPLGQYGASGIAFEAGVMGRNLTEWQYGLASIKPRWNVSGTYMQVIPRFISTNKDGGEQREFLLDFFRNPGEMMTNIFKKGYEWPFDVRKVIGGSSIIDVLVYIETFIHGRRVFLDFTKNPLEQPLDFKMLGKEAFEYLEKAGALFGTPVERLLHMNRLAYEFYLSRGVDLSKQPLEIALCAQHNNGGIAVDKWWQSNIEGFFAVGEVAATHGVYRPGGSALNAGQVGSTRAAQYIAANRKGEASDAQEFVLKAFNKIKKILDMLEKVLSDTSNVKQLLENAQKNMSRVGAVVRNNVQIEELLKSVKLQISNFDNLVKINDLSELPKMYRLYDVLISQFVYLSSMLDYIKHGGMSRGSAIYSDINGEKPDDKLPDMFRFKLDNGKHYNLIQEVILKNGECEFFWRPVHEIPNDNYFFENIWKSYRENGNIY